MNSRPSYCTNVGEVFMKKWQIQITGHAYDLEDVYENQNSASWSVVEDNEEFFLQSKVFYELEDADEVREAARRIISLINGSAKLKISGFRPIEIGNVYYIDEEGKRLIFVKFQESISARSRLKTEANVIGSNGSEVMQENELPDLIEPTFSLAVSDPNVSDALRLYASIELNWADLYKIYEIIRDDVGGSQQLFDREYVLKKELRNFSHTAQHPGAIGDDARHARIASEVPANPISLVEANLLISTLLNKWIDSKLFE